MNTAEPSRFTQIPCLSEYHAQLVTGMREFFIAHAFSSAGVCDLNFKSIRATQPTPPPFCFLCSRNTVQQEKYPYFPLSIRHQNKETNRSHGCVSPVPYLLAWYWSGWAASCICHHPEPLGHSKPHLPLLCASSSSPSWNYLTPCDPCPTRPCVADLHLLRFSSCFPLMFDFQSFKRYTWYSSTTLGWYARRTAVVQPEASKGVKRASDFPFVVRMLISSCCSLARDTHMYD